MEAVGLNQPFAYRVMYLYRNDSGQWETECCITGWATQDTLSENLAGAYEQVSREHGVPYFVIVLPPGQFFDDGPARLEVVH